MLRLVTWLLCSSVLQGSAWAAGVSRQVDAAVKPTASVALGTGFPGMVGLYGSYWVHDWVAVDAAAELAMGLAASGGASLHVPLLRHGNGHRHALVGAARVGYLVMGGTLTPKQGPYQVVGAGYGYRGPHMDVRVLVGVSGTYYSTPHPYRPGWESKPMVSLQVGKTFG